LVLREYHLSTRFLIKGKRPIVIGFPPFPFSNFFQRGKKMEKVKEHLQSIKKSCIILET
jgi:hypothetical protein